MSNEPHRHPFLDDLGADVELVASILRRPVKGRDLVTTVVKAGAAQYRSQTPIFLGDAGEGRTLFEYKVELTGGQHADGIVSIRRNDAGEVTHLHIAFSPIDAVLAMASGVRDTLAGKVDAGLFL